MILVFFGEDTFRARKKIEQLIERHRQKYQSGLNLAFFNLQEIKYQDFKSKILATSMFSEKKFFILENAKSNPEFKQRFLQDIEQYKGEEFLILFFEKKDVLKDQFFQKLKKHAAFYQFKPLSFNQLKIWIKGEFKKYKREIEEEAVNKLIFYVGNDLWQMEKEIKKLLLYKKGKILSEDVEKLVAKNLKSDTFAIIEAIVAQNKKKALNLIYGYLEKGEKVSSLVSILKKQWRSILILRDLMEKGLSQREIVLKTGFHPFFVEKNINLIRKCSLENLVNIYRKIFELDFNLKTLKLSPESALKRFVFQI